MKLAAPQATVAFALKACLPMRRTAGSYALRHPDQRVRCSDEGPASNLWSDAVGAIATLRTAGAHAVTWWLERLATIGTQALA